MEDPSSSKNTEIDAELVKRFRRAVTSTYDALAKLGLGDDEGLAALGALEMAHRQLRNPTTSQGFARLWEMGRLEQSVEALALRPEFASLFSEEERRIARDRLVNKGYEDLID